jgi:hypothetical protein
MQKLVESMQERYGDSLVKPAELNEFCREIGVFTRLVGDDNDSMGAENKNIQTRIFTRFSDRKFSGGQVFKIYEPGVKHRRSYYVQYEKS